MIGKILLVSLTISSVLASEHCYSDVVGACGPAGGEVQNCNAKYGHAVGVIKDLQNYANVHIARNFQFLLLSIHFNNYNAQRGGFSALFRKYADKTWEDSINLIKYIAKRGGSMDFAYKKQAVANTDIENYEMSEILSMSKSLDIWKAVAEEAHNIHGEAARRREQYHDPEVSSYIENNFVHQHAEIIRELAGHTNDLKRLLAETTDASLALFLFDHTLKN